MVLESVQPMGDPLRRLQEVLNRDGLVNCLVAPELVLDGLLLLSAGRLHARRPLDRRRPPQQRRLEAHPRRLRGLRHQQQRRAPRLRLPEQEDVTLDTRKSVGSELDAGVGVSGDGGVRMQLPGASSGRNGSRERGRCRSG